MPGSVPSTIPLLVGTYTDGSSRGIYRLTLDTATGALGEPALAAEAVNPTFLAWHPRLPRLYAVREDDTAGPERHGRIVLFAAEADGGLTAIQEKTTGGAWPCYVSVLAHEAGAHLLVANYHGGSVAALPIGPDGRIGPVSSLVRHAGSSVHPLRQRKPYAHAIRPAPDGRFALAADLGIDRLIVYRFDARTGVLHPHDATAEPVADSDGAADAAAAAHAAGPIVAEPGAGPRHLAFTPSGDALFVVNELDSTLAAYAWDAARGTLARRGDPVSTLPDGFSGENTAAEVAVLPTPTATGRTVVYASNRGHDSIALFHIGADPTSPTLTRVALHSTHGQTPRHFAIDPTGTFLIAANQDSDSLIAFRIDRATGRLSDTGARASVPSPAFVCFSPLR